MDHLLWLVILSDVLTVLFDLVCVKGSEANGRRARVWFRHPRKYGRIFAGDVESPSLMPLLLLLLCAAAACCLLLLLLLLLAAAAAAAVAAVAAACCCRC